MNYKRDIIAGGALLTFAVVYVALSFSVSVFQGIGSTPLTARFIPQLWGSCLILLSGSLLLRGLRAYKKIKSSLPQGERSPLLQALTTFYGNNREVILCFATLLVYSALLEPLGFVIMSSLLMFALMMILTPKGKRKPLMAAILSVVFATGLDYIFVVLLRVLLPQGILGF